MYDLEAIILGLNNLFSASSFQPSAPRVGVADRVDLLRRSFVLSESVKKTILSCESFDDIISLLRQWMRDQSVIRVMGAGRARLAASIPANRLAHGGARVFIQDDLTPLPHTIKGGGIIAASASGRTVPLLEAMERVKKNAPHITVLGIADAKADQFRGLCTYFIGIEIVGEAAATLHALADFGELIIAEVLDAMTVGAGQIEGYDERMWKLGHENLGATGPYDHVSRPDFRFSD